MAQVGHLQQGGPAADVRRRRRDHLSALDALAEDGAVRGRPHFRVLERNSRVLDVDPRPDDGRLGVRDCELELIELGLVDPLAREQRPAALELAPGRAALRLSRVQLRLGLCDAVAGRAGIDADQQCAATHGVAGLGADLEDFARRLGLELDRAHGLDDTRGLDGERQ